MTENKKAAVALGYFDGIHLGHKNVLESVLSNQNGYNPVVLLFDEHPQKVLFNREVPYIMTADDRDCILHDMGFETVTVSFRNICTLSPEEFVRKILTEKLNAGYVACGYNYTFGKNGAGNSSILSRLCALNDIQVCVSEEVKYDGISVSSTIIREYIKNGRIDCANTLLGRPYSFSSSVFSGDKRGRKLGFPTINQYIPDGIVIPQFGVYASIIDIDGAEFYGVSNVGNRPTFDGVSVRCETYILGYSGNLYEKKIRTSLIEFIRPEMKFNDISSLIEHIRHDADTVQKKYLKAPGE